MPRSTENGKKWIIRRQTGLGRCESRKPSSFPTSGPQLLRCTDKDLQKDWTQHRLWVTVTGIHPCGRDLPATYKAPDCGKSYKNPNHKQQETRGCCLWWNGIKIAMLHYFKNVKVCSEFIPPRFRFLWPASSPYISVNDHANLILLMNICDYSLKCDLEVMVSLVCRCHLWEEETGRWEDEDGRTHSFKGQKRICSFIQKKKKRCLHDSKELQEWCGKIRTRCRKKLMKIHTIKTITLVLSHRWGRTVSREDRGKGGLLMELQSQLCDYWLRGEVWGMSL